MSMTEMLGLIPESVRVPILFLIIGGGGAFAAESRYMTVADYTKSYVLNLKSEIREIQKELADPEIDPDYRDMLMEQLEALVDELCYERPDDAYCHGR
jgi:hypothetical protein